MSKNTTVSNSVIRRLPRYYRFLGDLLSQNVAKMSSRELSEKMGLTASQIRQDLNCFGGFGQQGYGYNLAELYKAIGNLLGIDNQVKTILIGAGNLGRAIASHIDFNKRGCNLIAIFDSDESLKGTNVAGVPVHHIVDLNEFCKENKPVIAILCIPKTGAQAVADELVSMGIKAFWNYSHYDLQVNYKDIIVENVHLGDSLLTLTYRVNNQ